MSQENPIQKFNNWWHIAKSKSPLKQKSAVCLSTLSPTGFPNGRFVDLKVLAIRDLFSVLPWNQQKVMKSKQTLKSH